MYIHLKERVEMSLQIWNIVSAIQLSQSSYNLRIFGDYESLEAGKARDAMVDMMGGVGQGVELQDYA